MKLKITIKNILPGMLVVIGISVLAMVVSRVWSAGPGAICLAILFGMVAGNLLPSGHGLSAGFDWAEHAVLPVAIALMGTELELHGLGDTGATAALVVLPPMALAILLALPLGRLLGLSVHTSLMLGIGNSVCGSSAVLAAAPALDVRKHEVAVAIASVNLMGMTGMFLLPVIASALGLSGIQTADLIGGSLQAVGQVAASGFSVSSTVGDHALIVKMLRVLMIGPIVMLLHHLFHKPVGGAKRRFPRVPGYILGFMCCALVASQFPPGNVIVPKVKGMAQGLMMVAMAGIGCHIRIRSLLAQGPKALLLVGALSLVQAGMVLLLLNLTH